jgi:hypothetical protein
MINIIKNNGRKQQVKQKKKGTITKEGKNEGVDSFELKFHLV